MTATDEDPLAPFRAELRAHCYRMLGSAHDAEDVLQDVSVRAWKGLDEFEGRSSKRTWLHKIAVNACLNELDRKERRVTPIELAPAVDGGAPYGEFENEILWLEPLPDDPEQSLADRESVELALVAAVQHLPANQRAALIMFESLGFSAQEIADAMDTSVASVNSALQRARSQIESELPEESQQQTLEALGDTAQRELVERYTNAMVDQDVDAMLDLLTEDATWSMPPYPAWFSGRESIRTFLAEGPMRERWRHVPTRANGQLAVAVYRWDEQEGAYVAFCVDVLTLRGGRISAVYAFLDAASLSGFGLPERLD